MGIPVTRNTQLNVGMRVVNNYLVKMRNKPFKDEAQTALVKDPVRTAQ